jgi:outer membrane lipoprotein LolB
MHFYKLSSASFFLLISGALMSGCATTPSAPPSPDSRPNYSTPSDLQIVSTEAQQHQANLAHIVDFKINGRMGVQTQGYGVSGNIHWMHSKEKDAIDLYSPLGNKMAAIVKNADGASLTSQDGTTIKAQDAETLTELTLGWRLPLSKLSDWIVGRPAQGIVSAFTFDEKGQASKFNQDGWEISYIEYQSESQPALPSKINLRNPKMNVRIIIESWDTSSQLLSTQDNNTAPIH